MARDYAKYNAKRRLPNKKNRYPELFAVFVLLSVIGITCYWVYAYKLRNGLAQNSQFSHAWARVQLFFHPPKKPVELSVTEKTKAAAPDDIQFNFYDELPTMQVTPPDTENTIVATKPSPLVMTNVNPKTDLVTASAPVAKTIKNLPSSGFLLKIGNFKDLNEASEMRISLLLMGIDAEIYKTGDHYYLKQGAYPNALKAKEAQKRLQQKGIESTVEKTEEGTTIL